jgi:hypothetical protein
VKLAFVFASLLSAAPAFAADGDWRVVYDRSVEVPDGDSYSSDILLRITDAQLLRVEMRNDRGARCDTRTTAIDVSQTEDQRYYKRYVPNAEGVFELEAPTIIYIKFHNYQDSWRTAYCRRVVYAKAATDAPTDDFEIAGVAAYDGGFRTLDVPVDSRAKVTKIKVDVPAFCAGVETLTVQTMTEGVWDAAMRRGDVYAVNGGAGSRISAIRVQLNGPRGMGCDVPVWIATQAE